MINEDYTLEDHEFRDNDPYASAKYSLTLRWLAKAGLPPNAVLANVGCGAGHFNEIAFAAGLQVVGYEPDESAYRLAAERAAGRYEVNNLGVLDIADVDFADVIVMHDVLEHIDAEAAVIDHLAEMLKPGGVLIISVPALESVYGYHDVQLGHFRRYTRTSLCRAMSRRFSIERSRYLGFSLIPVAWWYSRVRRKPYPVANVGTAGVVGRAVELLCRVESRLPTPLGTSTIASARKTVQR